MATTAFRVENGITPGDHNTVDLGHNTLRFRHVYGQGNLFVAGDADIDGNLDVDGSTTLENLSATGSTISLPNFDGGGGGGGGVSTAQAIAFAVALG